MEDVKLIHRCNVIRVMKEDRIFGSLGWMFGAFMVSSMPSSAATFVDGVFVDSSLKTYFMSHDMSGNTTGEVAALDGALYLHSDTSESAPGYWDGGLVLWGQPVTVFLGNWIDSQNGQFRIFAAEDLDVAPPLFEIDGATSSASFTAVDVTIDQGSLTVDGNTLLKGTVILDQAQGDISMGNYE